ncbi:hypothetical protein A2706_02565 [Candidatus Peribacteria bacterium RIFCSPHIGHO2_01_FULL_51_35]|nr:MAG: hypothetical protein A2706_02565 [Candidatus Peribacteria bacterium RIFCSPHIGHO2_01_FULL_51_35]
MESNESSVTDPLRAITRILAWDMERRESITGKPYQPYRKPDDGPVLITPPLTAVYRILEWDEEKRKQ